LGLDLDRFLAALDELFAPILEGDPDRVVTLDESRVPPMVLEPPPTEWPEIPAWIYEPEERDAR
jgi:hypothetical protein